MFKWLDSSLRKITEKNSTYFSKNSICSLMVFFYVNTFETKIVICLKFIGQCENLLWKLSVFVKLIFQGYEIQTSQV